MGYYYVSNDTIAWESNIKSDNSVFVGVANHDFFHALHVAIENGNNFRRLIAIDNNPEQISHFNKLLRLIEACDHPTQYVNSLFCGNFSGQDLNFPRDFRKKQFKLTTDLDGDLLADDFGRPMIFVSNCPVVGEADAYYLSPYADCRLEYNGKWVLSAKLNSGFLSTVEAFLEIRKLIPLIQVQQGDISRDIQQIIEDFRYHHVIIWVSNLLSEFFVDKFPSMKKFKSIVQDYASRKAPRFPEMRISIIRDQRSKGSLPCAVNIDRKLSVHTNSFERVAKYVSGELCEIVNVRKWAAKGKSALGGRCAMANMVESVSADTIFLHILVGHGMCREEFKEIFRIATEKANSVIVLEHNSESKDFLGTKGMSLREIVEDVGEPDVVEYCPGELCHDRNILLVYRGRK